jgi:hypothetical protein
VHIASCIPESDAKLMETHGNPMEQIQTLPLSLGYRSQKLKFSRSTGRNALGFTVPS